MRNIYALVCLAMLLYSCNSDQLDFENANIVLEPTLIAPIVNLELNLGDMVGEIDEIDSDSAGNLLVFYRDLSAIPPLKAIDLLDLPGSFGIPNAFFPLGSVQVEPIDVVETTAISEIGVNWESALYAQVVALDGTSAVFPAFTNEIGGTHSIQAPANFISGNVTTGFFQLELLNQWPIDLQNVDVTLKENGVSLGSFSFASVPAQMSSSSLIPINNLSIGNNFSIEVTAMSSSGSIAAVPVDLADQLVWNLRTTALSISSGNAVLSDQLVFNSSSVVDIALTEEEITLLELLDGELSYDLSSDIPQATILRLTFLESLDSNGDTLVVDINIPKNGIAQGSSNLSSSIFRLDQISAQPYNQFTIQFELLVSNSDGLLEPIASTQNVSGSLSFDGFEFDYVEGFFGTSIEDLTGNDLELDLEFLDRLTGEFYLEDPIIKLLTDNSLGIPIRTNFDLIGTSREGDMVPLNLQPSDIGYPNIGQVGLSIQDQILIDRNTSNIINFLGNIPEVMSFDGSIDINPDGNVGTNFLTNNGRLFLGVEIDMGLNLRVDDLGFTDTLNLGLEVDNDQLNPKTVILHANVDNGFGLDADIKLIMLNASGQAMDSVAFNFMQAGITDADGFVIESTFVENRIELNEAQTESLFNTESLVLSAELNSPQDGAENYVMNVQDFLKIYLAVESKVQINLNGN